MLIVSLPGAQPRRLGVNGVRQYVNPVDSDDRLHRNPHLPGQGTRVGKDDLARIADGPL